MDRTGRTRIPPQFDFARDFMEGLAAVSNDGKWGYINERGTLVISPRYDQVGDFVEGLAVVLLGRRWGYIDRSGRIAIAPQFQRAHDFHDGLAKVETWEKVQCSGREFTNEDAPEYAFYDLAFPSSCFPRDPRYSLVDKVGTLVIQTRFAWVEDFHDGLALVRTDPASGGKSGYIDRTGALAVPPRFETGESFSEGLAGVRVSSRREGNQLLDINCGYIDKSGRLVIPATFEFVGAFSEGLARVGRTGRAMGYIDRAGTMVIPPRFNQVWDFSEGMAAACDDRGCSYIDRTGKSVLKVSGAWWPFSDGLTVVPATGAKQRYIDKKGRTVALYK